jgi:hypothetical protein
MFRFNTITLLVTLQLQSSQVSLCAHRQYGVKQTTPLELPENTASSFCLSQLRNYFNHHAQTSDTGIRVATHVNSFCCVMRDDKEVSALELVGKHLQSELIN